MVHIQFAADRGATSTPDAAPNMIFEERLIKSDTEGLKVDSIEGNLSVSGADPRITIYARLRITVDGRHQGGFDLVQPKPITVDATNTAAFDLDLPPGVSFSSSSGVFLTESAPPPEFSCVGYKSPLSLDDPSTEFFEGLTIGERSKRTIPVRTALEDTEGFIVTGIDIPLDATGDAEFPVINISYASDADSGSFVSESELLSAGQANDGNTFRYDPEEQQWVFNLGTRDLSSSGVYTISMMSGDEDSYRIDEASCTVSFRRK